MEFGSYELKKITSLVYFPAINLSFVFTYAILDYTIFLREIYDKISIRINYVII